MLYRMEATAKRKGVMQWIGLEILTGVALSKVQA